MRTKGGGVARGLETGGPPADACVPHCRLVDTQPRGESQPQ